MHYSFRSGSRIESFITNKRLLFSHLVDVVVKVFVARGPESNLTETVST